MNSLNIIKLFIVVIFVSLYGLVFVITTNDKERSIENTFNKEIDHLENNYKVSIDRFKIISDNLYDTLLNRTDILELLYRAKIAENEDERALIRDALYKLILPHYTNLNKLGLNTMLFSFENNKTFLRVHEPSKFGDDISQVRYSVAYVNANKKLTRGFEEGKISHAFRNVFPLYYGDEYIGCVDLAFSSEIMQNNMRMLYNTDTHFILSKNVFETNIWKAQKQVDYIQSIEHDDFLFAVNKDSESFSSDRLALVKELKNEIRKNIQHDGSFALYNHTKDNTYVVTFLPIKNIKENKTVAYLVSYSKNYDLQSKITEYMLINIISFTVLLLLAVVIYSNIKQRLHLQREVEKKTKELSKINEELKQKVKYEVSKNMEKERVLLQQSKMAMMGEMIGNIAHQWRQPLNALSLVVGNINDAYTFGRLDDAYMKKASDKSLKLITKMSNTIDDFRDFFQPNKSYSLFCIQDNIKEVMNILEGTLKKESITIKMDFKDECYINGFANEYSHVVINIINNAKDALVENGIESPTIDIKVYIEKDDCTLRISDNAGGIPEDIIERMFEPYFTTKHQKNGTGIGLYMSKIIIEEHMNGKLSVYNDEKGAVFEVRMKSVNE